MPFREVRQGEGRIAPGYPHGYSQRGDLGPAVVPKNLSDSLLIEAVHWENDDMQMPPKKKLANADIKILEQWIRMGAPDPRDGITVVRDEIDLRGRKGILGISTIHFLGAPFQRQLVAYAN